MSDRILICVSASDTLKGRIVRWATRSIVNHTFVIYQSKLWGGWWAAQIDERGVRKIPFNQLKYTYLEKYELADTTKTSLALGVRAMRNHIGDSYDWLGLLWGLFKLTVKRLTGWNIRGVVHSDERLFCSEFVASVLQRAGIHGTEKWTPESVSPAMIRRFLLCNALFKNVIKL